MYFTGFSITANKMIEFSNVNASDMSGILRRRADGYWYAEYWRTPQPYTLPIHPDDVIDIEKSGKSKEVIDCSINFEIVKINHLHKHAFFAKIKSYEK